MVSNLNKRVLFIVITLALIAWCGVSYIIKSNQNKQEINILLRKTQEELSKLKKRNIQLQKLVGNNEQKLVRNKINYNVPTLKYETLRRRVMRVVQEFWYFIKSKMSEIKNQENIQANVLSTVNNILLMGFEYKRTIVNNIEKLTKVDGFNKWRLKEITDLSNIVQKRLNYLQNQMDCKKAKN